MSTRDRGIVHTGISIEVNNRLNTLLVTGGTGSFGNAVLRSLLSTINAMDISKSRMEKVVGS
jgi:FlaA1/EpsC-like NDP-sugar epimerase